MAESEQRSDRERVARLFEEAVSLDPQDVDAFLEARCDGDAALKRSVVELIRADHALAATKPAGKGARLEPAPSEPSAPELPRQIGRFSISRKLGEGGMGVVLEGFDAQLDRAIAIKLLRVAADDAAGARLRLLREAQALAKVAHPNVLPVYEAGMHGDDVFIAMELVTGGTLASYLRSEPRDWRDIARRFVDAGRGLYAVHEAGIVHRDFKPENVLLGADGRARVADFGLARARGGARADASAAAGRPVHLRALDVELTRQGTIMGTPSYMSPEHFEGKDVSPASDQFCFAIALYRALFDRNPFEGSTVAELRKSVLDGAPNPPPASDVPAPIVAAVMRGLARTPEDRWPSMKELVDVIERELFDDPDLNPATARGARIAVVAALLCIGVVRIATHLRNDTVFDAEAVMEQGLIAPVAMGVIGLVFRKSVLKTRHNRRVALFFFLTVSMMLVRRLLALGSTAPVLEGLRDEAVGLIALCLLAAFLLERWIAVNVVALAAFAIAATFVREMNPVWFGATLNVMLVTAVIAWGRGERAARRATRDAATPLSHRTPSSKR